MQFKAHAPSNKILGLWAASLLDEQTIRAKMGEFLAQAKAQLMGESS